MAKYRITDFTSSQYTAYSQWWAAFCLPCAAAWRSLVHLTQPECSSVYVTLASWISVASKCADFVNGESLCAVAPSDSGPYHGMA